MPPEHLVKKTKKVGDDLAGTCALSQSPSKSSIVCTARREAGKNPKAGPSTKSNAVSPCRNPIIPTRVSSRVSRPTLKKKASSFKRKSPSLESDGTPPSIISPAPPLSLKRKKPTNRPIKNPTGNNTPYKSKSIDPNPIELTSDDDDNKVQPPRKRVKHTPSPRKPVNSEIIDLCSESEDVISLPKRRRTRDKRFVVAVSSTDEELSTDFPASSSLALRETGTRENLDSVFRASPPTQTHSTPVTIPNISVAGEDGVTDEHNTYTEKVRFPRGSLQILYNEALARCVREPQHAEKTTDQPSSFSSHKCMSPTHISTHSQSQTLHTPLFFNRIIHRLRARLKLRKTLNAKSFPDGTNLASKFNEREGTSDTIMELSPVESGVPAKIIIVPIGSQDDTLSDIQGARISPSTLVSDLGVNKRYVSRNPSPLANQKSPLSNISIPESIQALEASTNSKTASPEGVNSWANSPNIICRAKVPFNLTNPNNINYQIETPQEAETILFRGGDCASQGVTIEPSVLKSAQFLVQALRRRYDASNISGSSLLPAMELNDTRSSTAPESLCQSPVRSTEHAKTTNIPSLTISGNNASDFERVSESPMILADHTTIRDIVPHAASCTGVALLTSESSETPMMELAERATFSPTRSSGEDAPSNAKYLFESPAILTEHATTPNLSSPASSSGADTLSSGSRQSSDHNVSIEPVKCRLATPEDSPSPPTPPIKAQKQEPFIRSNPSPSIVSPSLDMDLSEWGLRTLMSNNSKLNEDDDDDDESVSGMELVYPEEII